MKHGKIVLHCVIMVYILFDFGKSTHAVTVDRRESKTFQLCRTLCDGGILFD